MGACASMPERRIVLLGRKGEGKSSSVNTILGKKVFTPKAPDNPARAERRKKKTRRHGRQITVIETPGFFDTDGDDMEMKSEIIKSLVEIVEGVDAFVIVLKVRTYTEEEMEVLHQRLSTLTGDVFDHTVILFTFGEQLEGQTIEEFVKANSKLQELVDKCGGRCYVVDNKRWKKRNRVQVRNLLDTIDEMRNKNGCYTNELLQMVEHQIQQEIRKMDEENLHPEEKREKAKENVQNKMLERVAGVATGALIGAFLGAATLVFLQNMFPIKALMNVLSVVGLRGAVTGRTAAETEEKTGGAVAETGDKTGGAAAKTGDKKGGAAAETGDKTGGAAAETADKTGGAAAETADKTGAVTMAMGAALTGGGAPVATGCILPAALGGAVTGWEAAKDADSVYDAMIKAAKLNYDNATIIVEKVQTFFTNTFIDKTQTEKN